MPRHSTFEIQETPLHQKARVLRLSKAYTSQSYTEKTVLTDDVFPYVEFYYNQHHKPLKYQDTSLQQSYGKANQYECAFYWKQAEMFYKTAKTMPIETSPVAAYYCMLNATKSYLSFTSTCADDFVKDFSMHGLLENHAAAGEDLDTIEVAHMQVGVFPMFAKALDSDFETIWAHGKGNTRTLQALLYNLPFVHRAYSMTYTTPRKKVDELFIPLKSGTSPTYYKGNDGKAYLCFDLDEGFFSVGTSTLPSAYANTISQEFEVCSGKLRIRSTNGATYNSDSISTEMKIITPY